MRVFSVILAVCVLVMSVGCAGRKRTETPVAAVDPVVVECSQLATFSDNEFPGWRLASPINTYDKKTIFDYINGAAELYFAYDFRRVAAAEYQNGETSIVIDVYDMTSPECAFGIYSLNRYPEANYTDIGNEAILDGTALDFWKGRYFCKVYSFDMSEKYKEDVVNFGSKLALKILEAGAEPAVLERLPQDGLTPKTAMFFSRKLGLDNIHFISEENVLNLNGKTKGVVAEYQINGDTAQFFIVEYPSSEEAITAFETYASYLDGKGKPATVNKMPDGKFKLVNLDGKFTLIALEDQTLMGFWDIETQETLEFILQ
jgi:hypothetical protein